MQEVPYPSETRAKGWRFELDHERIRQSDTWALCPADLRPWLLMLWMVAWEQTPCGALPDDDTLIAARIGMSPKVFTRAKESLMRGWWKAVDGRLYHSTIVHRVFAMLEKRAKDAQRAANRRARAPDAAGVNPESRVTQPGQPQESDPSSTPSTKHQAPVNTSLRSVERASKRCPENFVVTDELRAWAAKECPGVDVDRETAKLRDHTFKTARQNWAGVWRNWLREALERLPARPGDIARVTVPGSKERDPALVKLDEDAKKAAPLTPERRASLDAVRKGRTLQ